MRYHSGGFLDAWSTRRPVRRRRWFPSSAGDACTVPFSVPFERFIGILIENYEGAFPAWLAPEQAVVLNITDKQADYADKVAENTAK